MGCDICGGSWDQYCDNCIEMGKLQAMSEKGEQMHSINEEDWTVHYNGDFSGDVVFTHTSNGITKRLDIPFRILKLLVGEHVRNQRIDTLKQATVHSILGLKA